MKIIFITLFLLLSTFLKSQPTTENFILSIDSLTINNEIIKIDKIILPLKSSQPLSRKERKKASFNKLYKFNETTILFTYGFNMKDDVVKGFIVRLFIEVDGKRYQRVIKTVPVYSHDPVKNENIINQKKEYLEPVELFGYTRFRAVQKYNDKIRKKSKTSIVNAKIKFNYTY